MKTGRPAMRARALVGVVAAAALLAGCATGDTIRAGAPPAPARTAPTVVTSSSPAPLVARDVPTDHASPTAQAAVSDLSVRIDAALAAGGNRSPGTRLTQRPAAGNQMLVRWMVGTQPPDAATRQRVRTEALTVLDLVRRSGVAYGSVLLLASGDVLADGRRSVSVVVRAKYTHALVVRTAWSRVSPNAVLGMCDDKPAVVAAGYR